MEITLKELEEKMIKENKSGYVKIELPVIGGYIGTRNIKIGYFKDCANWNFINYEKTKVNFIEYVGWRN